MYMTVEKNAAWIKAYKGTKAKLKESLLNWYGADNTDELDPWIDVWFFRSKYDMGRYFDAVCRQGFTFPKTITEL